ncbi:MAG TPA: alpha/beta hydrolase [Isosphaeraceae bacterium]|nr:alpha/beta hydrolase [Isosphaeraceae bacterium]
MAETAEERGAGTARRWRPVIRGLRVASWVALAVVTGLLVRAEGQRPDQPPGIQVSSNLVYHEAGDPVPRLDLYAPRAPEPGAGRPAIIAIHGGGWRGGSKDDYGRSLMRLAEHGYVVAAIDYRLSRPGAPSWPANFEDVREAVRWLRRHAKQYGVDPGRIAALGASAGGHLAALLGTCPDDAARVQAVIDFYGPTDLRALYASRKRTTTSLTLLLGGRPDECPARYESASPIHHVSADDPPMLLIHGGDDALVPLGQSRALADALARAGVPHRLIVIENARHGFGLEVQGRDLLPEILAFLDSAWKGSPGQPTPGN